MWVLLVIGLVVAVVAVLLWQQRKEGLRVAREREDRRAHTDQLLARVLLGEEPTQGRRTGGTRPTTQARPVAPRGTTVARPTAGPRPVDPATGAAPASAAGTTQREGARPIARAPDPREASTGDPSTAAAAPAPLALLDGQIDVPLDALVVAWYEARGYEAKPAPDSARPIRLLLTHRDDPGRGYAFVFERGRLSSRQAAMLLEQAHALGMGGLLVAAEHGADPAVGVTRLRDVQVMDWPAIDRRLKKIDFDAAARIVAAARASRRTAAGG